MAPKARFLVILFLLSSLYITSSSDRQADYDNWISWNVKNYQRKTTLETKLNVIAPGATGQAPDLRLRNAESNKVRITVSQDGAGDFKTITEALNSIPPRNTRRIVVSIAPGVYRYVEAQQLDVNFNCIQY